MSKKFGKLAGMAETMRKAGIAEPLCKALESLTESLIDVERRLTAIEEEDARRVAAAEFSKSRPAGLANGTMLSGLAGIDMSPNRATFDKLIGDLRNEIGAE